MVNNGRIVNATAFCSWWLLFLSAMVIGYRKWSITIEKPATTNFLRGDRTINNSCGWWWCQMSRNRWDGADWLGWLKPPGSHSDPQFGIKIWLDTMHTVYLSTRVHPPKIEVSICNQVPTSHGQCIQYLNIHQSPERSLVEFDSSFYSSWAAHEFVPKNLGRICISQQ